MFPQPFGPYRLERFIAAGGMAEVFLATRVDGSIPGALCVKRMLPEMTKNPDYVTMFRDEASLSMRLVHDNIVRVFDQGLVDGRMYMAMEYVDGIDAGSLQKKLRQRQETLTPAHALRVGAELCAGLHHAHTLVDERRRPLKLIHRDVSPQNILISAAGEVKVTDFGIAKAVGRETHTQTGLIKGKIQYMAPEQALGQYIDQRVDQFAAGIVVWELLTGQRLYQEPSELLTFEKIIRKPPPRPSAAKPGIPAFVDAIVLRALQKSPDERYPDVAAFGHALSQGLAQLGGPARADLASVMSWVMGAGGAPPSSAPPAQLSSGGMSAVATAPTRVTPAGPAGPAAVERLPTANMMPLPLPATPSPGMSSPALAPDPGTPRTGSRGGMRVMGANTAAAGVAAAESGLQLDQTAPALDALPRSSPMLPPAPITQSTRSAGLPAAQPAGSRVSVPLLAAALVAGLVGGFIVAKATAAPAKSGADCAVPSTKLEDVQRATTAMGRAELSFSSGDGPAAAKFAEEANKAHGTAAAHMLLGRIAMQSGNRLLAFTHFRCVVALDPMGPNATELEKQLRER